MRLRHQEPEPRPDCGRFAGTGSIESQWDEYLNDVVRHLGNAVSPTHRREIRRELAAHLEALADAYIELGHTPDEAVEAALRQFGSARKVGATYRAAALPSAPSLRTSLLTAPFFLFALLFFSSITLAVGEVFGVPALGAVLCGPFLPLLLGLHWGNRSPGAGSRWSPLLPVVFTSLLTTLTVPTPDYLGYLPFHGMWAVAQLCMWLIVACAAAGLQTAAWGVFERLKRAQPA
jgi:hypothetical protein